MKGCIIDKNGKIFTKGRHRPPKEIELYDPDTDTWSTWRNTLPQIFLSDYRKGRHRPPLCRKETDRLYHVMDNHSDQI